MTRDDGPLRRAGRLEIGGGTSVTWTVADGSKGRRWREVVVHEGSIVHSLLLETFPDGRFAHLELSTPAGLLTLHPEGDDTLHGNAVTADGVGHIVGRPFPRGSVVLVDGSIVARAATAALGPGVRSAVVVRADLSLFERSMSAVDGADLDVDGLTALTGAESWPLEIEDGA